MWLYADTTNTGIAEIRQGENNRLEWWSINMAFIKCYIYSIVSGFGWQIGHIACSITIVAAIDSRLARTFDGHTKTTLTRSPGIDHKLSRLSHQALLQTWSKSAYLIRVTATQTLQTKWSWRYGCATETYTQQVFTQLGGCEVHQESLGCGYDMSLDTAARRTGYGYSQIGLWQAMGNNAKLLETI